MKETRYSSTGHKEHPRGEFVRIREAAEKIYGCTTQNLYKHIRRGNLKTYKRFGHTVVNVEEVKELADFIEPRGGDRKFKPKKTSKKSEKM